MRKKLHKKALLGVVTALCVPLTACGTYAATPLQTDALTDGSTLVTVVPDTDVSNNAPTVDNGSIELPTEVPEPTEPSLTVPDMNADAKNDGETSVSEWDGNLLAAGWGATDQPVTAPEGFSAVDKDGVQIVTIDSAAALAYFSHEVYANNEKYSGCSVTLTCDIDLKNQLWIPIGFDNRSNATLDHAFKGKIKEVEESVALGENGELKDDCIRDGEKYYKITNCVFDAQGHTVSNLDGDAFIRALGNREDGSLCLEYGGVQLDVAVNHDHKHGVNGAGDSAKIEFHFGLFNAAANAEIKNLTVENFKLDYSNESDRFVSQCEHINELTGQPCDCKCTTEADSVGAIVGYAGAGLKLVNFTAGNENSDKEQTDYLYGAMCSGGLVGRVYPTLTLSNGVASYSNSGTHKFAVSFTNCTNYINVGTVTTDKKGGIVAYVHNATVITFDKCANYGNIVAEYAGGLVSYLYYGGAEFIFNNCYNGGDITATIQAGGLAGRLQIKNAVTNVEITGFINRGNITCGVNSKDNGSACGGVVGYFEASTDTLLFTDCYNYGEITVNGTNCIVGAKSTNLGGLIGRLILATATKSTVSGGNCGKVVFLDDPNAERFITVNIDGCIGYREGSITATRYLVNAYRFPETEGNNR